MVNFILPRTKSAIGQYIRRVEFVTSCKGNFNDIWWDNPALLVTHVLMIKPQGSLFFHLVKSEATNIAKE